MLSMTMKRGLRIGLLALVCSIRTVESFSTTPVFASKRIVTALGSSRRPENSDPSRRRDEYSNGYRDSDSDTRSSKYYDTNDRRQPPPYYSQDDDNYRNEYYYSDNDESNYYNNDYSTSNTIPDNTLEWERIKSTSTGSNVHVLLPPPSVDLPTAVLHVCGGTWVGSAPHIWYRDLLEELVQHTQVAVVATPIPVTILGKKGTAALDHVRLARNVRQQFIDAYNSVILDEYGDAVLKVPVAGLGHSLGSRILVVLSTLPPPRSNGPPIDYKSFMLISFTNFAAGAGIPGLDYLGKASRKLEYDQERERSKRDKVPTRQANRYNMNDDYNDGYDQGGDRRRRGYNNDDDEDDIDFSQLWQDLQSGVKSQWTRVKTALTPSSEALEFYPTPNQLWEAISTAKRYKVPSTLLVQFDQDEMDQSSKLAKSIVECKDDNGDDNTTSTSPPRVHFARLRGSHWTPLSPPLKNFFANMNPKRQRQSQEMARKELRQSIARYITEIVTK